MYNGSFTLTKFVSKTIGGSNSKQYLPWPPWVMRQEIETRISVLRPPRWPREVLFCVTGAGSIVHTLPMETQLKHCVIQGCQGKQERVIAGRNFKRFLPKTSPM